MATLEDNTVCFLAICIVVSVPYWLLYKKEAWELLSITTVRLSTALYK